MDKENVQLLLLFTWLMHFTVSATDWRELDGISTSVVKPHFEQLQDPNEMDKETNFQHSSEVKYINKPPIDMETADDTVESVKIQLKQDFNDTNASDEESESEEFSEEDTEKPLAVKLLGSNVRFTISAEDERYMKNKPQIIENINQHNQTSTVTTHSPTTTKPDVKTTITNTPNTVKESTKLTKVTSSPKTISFVFNTTVQNDNKIFNAKLTNLTRTISPNNTFIATSTVTIPKLTPMPIFYADTTTKTIPLKTLISTQITTISNSSNKNQINNSQNVQTNPPASITTTTSTSSTLEISTKYNPTVTASRPTIRSRLLRPKSLQKLSKLLAASTTTTQDPSTMQSQSFRISSSSSENYALPTESELSTSTSSESESIPVMTLLKDMTEDYPLDMPPDIETSYDESDRKQSSSSVMSASTTNTIVISSIIGGCAILFFAFMMLFYMWKQRKVRRRRKRRIPQKTLTKPNHNWQFGQMNENG